MFPAVSFLQRMMEGAFGVGMHGVKNTAQGALRSTRRKKGWVNRGRDIAESWRFNNTQEIMHDTVRAWQGTKGKGWAKAGFVATAPFRAAHGVMGAGIDVATGAAGTAATIGGTALNLGATAVAIPSALLLKGGWAVTKTAGKPLAKGLAKGTGALAYTAARDAGTMAAAGGKFLWKTRKNPAVGSMLVGGAIVAGAALGNMESEERAIQGSYFGGRGTGIGYMNPEVTGGAWQLTSNKLSKAGIEMQQRMMEKDGYDAVKTVKPPGGDTFGATGDLVFALNQLRQGGLF